jgi:hypothetical protein
LRAYDPHRLLISPSVDHTKYVKLDASETDHPQFAIVIAVVNRLHNHIVENFGRLCEGNAMLAQIGRSLGVVPFKIP